jgi:hypothetical protein
MKTLTYSLKQGTEIAEECTLTFANDKQIEKFMKDLYKRKEELDKATYQVPKLWTMDGWNMSKTCKRYRPLHNHVTDKTPENAYKLTIQIH